MDAILKFFLFFSFLLLSVSEKRKIMKISGIPDYDGFKPYYSSTTFTLHTKVESFK